MKIGDKIEGVRLSDYITRHSWVRDTIYGPVDFGFVTIDFDRSYRDSKKRLLNEGQGEGQS